MLWSPGAGSYLLAWFSSLTDINPGVLSTLEQCYVNKAAVLKPYRLRYRWHQPAMPCTNFSRVANTLTRARHYVKDQIRALSHWNLQ